MDSTEKIILGTVQFGFDYGINNQTGKIDQSTAKKILQLAWESGINMLDTSYGYGESEIVIGQIMREQNLNFKIISKYPQNTGQIKEIFEESLIRFHVTHLYGYLVHHFNEFKNNPMLWNSFVELKNSGKVEKIGFSLYSPVELNYLFDKNISFDIVQFPYNIFDRQFDPYMTELKKRKIEVHVRSVFLQGLFFKNVEYLDPVFYPLKPYLLALQSYCLKQGIDVENLALQYVLKNPLVDRVLIGIDSIAQLKRNIEATTSNICVDDIDFVHSILVREKDLLNPVNWK
ncbi:MAG: aldo/keto reductase [Prevotellaceae bacterium]|jgi:aryl-alcohol dehydrogenase-like predicted oxidoreductase|nr:aldo/keto reductase [Prevotellaceae bacterium]